MTESNSTIKAKLSHSLCSLLQPYSIFILYCIPCKSSRQSTSTNARESTGRIDTRHRKVYLQRPHRSLLTSQNVSIPPHLFPLVPHIGPLGPFYPNQHRRTRTSILRYPSPIPGDPSNRSADRVVRPDPYSSPGAIIPRLGQVGTSGRVGSEQRTSRMA